MHTNGCRFSGTFSLVFVQGHWDSGSQQRTRYFIQRSRLTPWDSGSSLFWAREALDWPGPSAPRTAPAGAGAGRTQRRHDARSLGARSRAAGATASRDPGNWLCSPRTSCAQPMTCSSQDCATARTRRPGERGCLATPGPCASCSPAVLGGAPSAPLSWGAAILGPEPGPVGGGGRGSERDLGSTLVWPRRL